MAPAVMGWKTRAESGRTAKLSGHLPAVARPILLDGNFYVRIGAFRGGNASDAAEHGRDVVYQLSGGKEGIRSNAH